MPTEPHGRHVARALDDYFAAWRWRRAVEHELRGLKLTLTQWLVLDACAVLSGEPAEPPNQRAIAQHIELDPMTVSQVMKTLVSRGLVERASDVTGRAYRVLVTKKGHKLLQAASALVDAGTRAAERARSTA
jgi:DNA-binding MarR family transcriptional regulator